MLIKFYKKKMAVPDFLYGCETWTLTKKDCQRIQAAEVSLLRAVAGYNLNDKKKNVNIRASL